MRIHIFCIVSKINCLLKFTKYTYGEIVRVVCSMTGLRLISYFCLLTVITNHYISASEIDNATKGINAITKALGDSALLFKKTYDQIDPNAVNTNKVIAANNAQAKDQNAKIDAILAGVKQWMINDSNTKRQALEVLQRNVDVIDKEVNKAKKQLEVANAAAEKVSAKDKVNFTDAIQGAANAVSANTQYYMATKTRLDYETKYKELLDTRNKRLDMVKKINDPSVIRELLSDNNDLADKKYANQLSDYVNQDARLHDKVYQNHSNSQTQPVQTTQTNPQVLPILPPITQQLQQQMQTGQQIQSQLSAGYNQSLAQPNTQQQQAYQHTISSLSNIQNAIPQINPEQMKQKQLQQFNPSENTIWHNVDTQFNSNVKFQNNNLQQLPQVAQSQQLPNSGYQQSIVQPQIPNQVGQNAQTVYTAQQKNSGVYENIVQRQDPVTQNLFVTQTPYTVQNVNSQRSRQTPRAQAMQSVQNTTIVNIGDENTQHTTSTILKSGNKQQVKVTTLNNSRNNNPLNINSNINKSMFAPSSKFTTPPVLVKRSVKQSANTGGNIINRKLPMPGLLASLPSDNY